MPICQRCGTSVPASKRLYQRELYWGTTERSTYGRRVSYGTSSRYSVKNVCEDCADEIDQQQASRKNQRHIKWLIVFILIIAYFLLK